MKKCIISFALVMAMVLSMTTVAFATETKDWESEIDVVGIAVVNNVYYQTVQAAVDAADGKIVKLLADSDEEIVAEGQLRLDLNGFCVTVNGAEVILTDSATDNGEIGGKLYGTATAENRVTENGAIRYLVLDGADEKGAYKTANAVRISMKSINIRPRNAGMYYATSVKFNQNVADMGVTYGVALSVVDQPTNDFKNDSDTLWTKFDVPAGAGFSSTGTSCLVSGIMKTPAFSDVENGERGTIDIYANAYVAVNVNGQEVTIMMENTATYSLQKVMNILDRRLEAEMQAYAAGTGALSATGEKVVAFYQDWHGAMTQTGWELNNLEAAYTKKTA